MRLAPVYGGRPLARMRPRWARPRHPVVAAAGDSSQGCLVRPISRETYNLFCKYYAQDKRGPLR